MALCFLLGVSPWLLDQLACHLFKTTCKILISCKWFIFCSFYEIVSDVFLPASCVDLRGIVKKKKVHCK